RAALPPLVAGDALTRRRLVKDPLLVANLPAAKAVKSPPLRILAEALPPESTVLPLAGQLGWPYAAATGGGLLRRHAGLRIDQPVDHRATGGWRGVGIDEDI